MSIGKLGPFDLDKDSWDMYVDRLEQYFVANDIKDAVKVATLISIMGREAYELLVTLCTPVKPAAKSFNDLVIVMKGHLQPKPSILAERYVLRQRKQQRSESVAEYGAVLKRLTKNCGFTAVTLSENLRDQFVCGLLNDNTRQRLFTEEDVQFEKAYKIAISMEAAEINAALVENRAMSDGLSTAAGASSAVHVVTTASTRRSGQQRRSAETRGPAGDGGGGHWARKADPAVAGGGRSGPDSGPRRPVNSGSKWNACAACGGQHSDSTCRFTAYVCRVCNRRGHLKRVCPNLPKNTTRFNMMQETMVMDSEMEESSDEVNILHSSACRNETYEPYIVSICIAGIGLKMEIDTGSAVSCIGYDCYKKLFAQHSPLLESDLSLRYYTGECVVPVGMLYVDVSYNNIKKKLLLYVVDKGKINLLGRQWLTELGVNLPHSYDNSIKYNNQLFNLDKFSSRYYEVFSEGLGRFTGGTVGFQLRPGARPVFMRARPLAYALREPVERALDSLVRDGVVTPVNTSDWATPIVPVMKKDGTIRVCGDFKITLNKVLEVDRFPLPRVEDLLTKLHGGIKFSKIDLSQAYAQFELDENSKQYTVINTHRGLFQYNRLIFGLASSPGIFQRKLEQLFSDMPRVGVFLDDLIITGENDRDHLETLDEVFNRLLKYGLKIKKEKCSFFADSVTYLGFVIDKEGVHTCDDKVEAIVKAPIPQNVSELRSFLGLVMYYAKFISNVSTLLSPLYNLLKKETKYVWDQDCETAFNRVKESLVSSEVLAHYSSTLPLVLTTDASSVGVGAVISHVTSRGERPVAYASRSLNAAERGYSQIEREALSIIFGIRKFHQYLYGRKFLLRTDHKPLVAIFGDKKGIPVMAASRMQRWAVLLSGYNYDIEYVCSKKNSADALSRLPVGKPSKEGTSHKTYLNFVQNYLPITRKTVQQHLQKDSVLKKVMLYLQSGWPDSYEESLKPFINRRDELYIDKGCIVWGYRLVIPDSLKDNLLKEIHVGHQGMVKMKAIARSVMWWPGIDADIERTSRECAACAAEASAPPRASPQPWPYHAEPWSRLHVDFLGPIQGKTFLVLIDSTTKWLEVFDMPRTTASSVIKVLRETFARFGLPKEVVSDNGPPFSSREYAQFMANNGVKVSFAAAYHPSSNGAAEAAVKICKRAIKKAYREKCDIDLALQTYLMAYRNVEHSSTGASPAMLLQRRQLRSRLDLLKDVRQVEDRVQEAQKKQVVHAGGVRRELQVGEKVYMRNYTGNDKWVPGTIENRLSSRNYLVGREDGPPTAKHIDQLRPRFRGRMPSFSDLDTVHESGLPSEDNRVEPSQASAPPAAAAAVSGEGSNDAQGPPVDVPRHNLRPREAIRPPVRYRLDID